MTPLDPQVLTELSRISSPTIANAIETFNVKPWNTGFVSSDIVCRFPKLPAMVGYAVTALIRAEPQPIEGHRANEFAWWEHVAASPGPRVVVMHDIDEPRGQGARQRGERSAAGRRRLGSCLVQEAPDAEVVQAGHACIVSAPGARG